MDKKYSNMGLNNGVQPSTLTDAESDALFERNGFNHPRARMSLLEQEVLSRKMQAEKPSEKKPED